MRPTYFYLSLALLFSTGATAIKAMQMGDDASAAVASADDEQDNDFLLYVYNKHAAQFYRIVDEKYDGDVDKMIRVLHKTSSLHRNEKFFRHHAEGFKLCQSIKDAKAKYNAQERFPTMPEAFKRLVIRLTVAQNCAVSDVRTDCMVSPYVYKFFAGSAAINEFLQAKREKWANRQAASQRPEGPGLGAHLLALNAAQAAALATKHSRRWPA